MSGQGERRGRGWRGRNRNSNYNNESYYSTYKNDYKEDKYGEKDFQEYSISKDNYDNTPNQEYNESSRREYADTPKQQIQNVQYESQENFFKKNVSLMPQMNSKSQREFETEEYRKLEPPTSIDRPTPALRNTKIVKKENVITSSAQSEKAKNFTSDEIQSTEEKENISVNLGTRENKGAKKKKKSATSNVPPISICMNCSKAVSAENHQKGHRVLPLNNGLQELKEKEISSLETAMVETDALLKSEMYVSDMVCLWKNSIDESVQNVFKSFERTSSENIDRLLKLTEEGNKAAASAKSTNIITILDLINLQTASQPVVSEGLRISSSLQSKPYWLLFNWVKLSLGLFISSGKEVFATSKMKTSHHYARLDLQGDRLLLHSLHPKMPAKDAVLMPFDAINNLFEREDFFAFMRLSYNGKNEGYLFMRLNKETFWGKQFVTLCSGEAGPSLRNTCFFRSCWKGRPGHHVWGGDYSRNDGSGGQAFLKSNDHLIYHPLPISQGLIAARPGYQDKSSIFRIYLRGEDPRQKSDATPLMDNFGFGNVIDGLDALSHVADLPDISQSKIEDTGRFLTLT